MWHDAHSHPQQLPDPHAALRRAVAQGVRICIAATEKPTESGDVFSLSEAFPGVVLPAVGLHPACVTAMSNSAISAELTHLEEVAPQCAALGEIGLDYKYAVTEEEKRRQREALQAQCEIARRFGLPVQLHSRRAQRHTMELAFTFTERTGLPALLHWFTASRKLIRLINEHPRVFISVGPSLLSSGHTAAAVSTICPDRILLETDCPVPIGSKPNEPARAAEVGQELARLLGLPAPELAGILAENLARYLRGRLPPL